MTYLKFHFYNERFKEYKNSTYILIIRSKKQFKRFQFERAALQNIIAKIFPDYQLQLSKFVFSFLNGVLSEKLGDHSCQHMRAALLHGCMTSAFAGKLIYLTDSQIIAIEEICKGTQ